MRKRTGADTIQDRAERKLHSDRFLYTQRQPFPAFAEAESSVEVVSIPDHAVRKWFDTSPVWRNYVLELLAQRFGGFIELIGANLRTNSLHVVKKNVGSIDRIERIAFAVLIGALFLANVISGILAIKLGIAAVIPLGTGSTGTCPAYLATGTSTDTGQ